MIRSIKNALRLNSPWRLYRGCHSKTCSARKLSSVGTQANLPSIGDELHGFKVIDVRNINELQLQAVRLQHVRTGADYLHVHKDDQNNAFCIAFRTTPMDSTGVPHILEHTVLCGSKKYPVRDPFFKMLNRSLSNFMNAMTGNDYTMYPFSTQNPTDYKNLMSVYLDAVLKPNLSSMDFQQEGWRLEHSDPLDNKSPLEFKGVVFNEMKGVFADSQNIFMEKLQRGVLPSHTYGVVSGGYPLDIPQLSWKQLKEFHKYHYHPSNSRIFSYGDQDLSEHLKLINDEYLSQYSKISPDTEVPNETSWATPRLDHIHCAIDPLANPDASETIAIVYKLSDINDLFESFVLSIIGELLVSGPNAPFYKSLLEPQLGNSYSPATGFFGHTKDTLFAVGLQGIKNDTSKDILAVIEKTFEDVSKDGFPKERIDAVMHSIELNLKHQTAKFGVNLAMNIAPFWNQGGNPVDYLEVNQIVEKLKQSINDDPFFFQKKICEYFIENNHKYTLLMTPKENFDENLKRQESELLSERVDLLTEDDKNEIFEQGKLLSEKQNATEDISCLPTLYVKNINRSVTDVETNDLILSDGVKVQVCPSPTNGVAYFNAVLDAQMIPDDLLPLLPLLSSIMTKMGAGEFNFREFDQKAELTTGGLYGSPHLSQHLFNYNIEKGLVFSSYCLQNNLDEMLALWNRVLNELNLKDADRFRTLVNMLSSNASNSIVHNGHGYAMQSAAASTSIYGKFSEEWSGLTYIKLLKTLAETQDLDAVLVKLRELAVLVLGKQSLRVALNVSPEHVDDSVEKLESFLNNVGGTPLPYSVHPDPPTASFTPQSVRTHHVFPFPVNYTSLATAGVPYGHPDAGALRVMGRLMFPYLHREIREKGGAYGGGLRVAAGGPLTFYSYRDPNALQTLQVFRDSLAWVLRGEFSERELEEAKLGVFQAVDAPVSPGSRGQRRFLSHVSDLQLERHRESILDTGAGDVVRVAREHLRENLIEGQCLIGQELERTREDPFWTVQNHS